MLELPPEEPQVLVVDDMPTSRAALKEMLHGMGFTHIEEASGGREALEKLRSQGAQLIVCDYMMNDMSGLDLLNQLRNHAYLVDIPFIVVSSNGDVPVIETAMDLGAAEYLVKPLSFNLLKKKITDVLMRRMNS
jgi:CheY-like chemotaxis protein